MTCQYWRDGKSSDSCLLFQLKRLKLRRNNWDSDTYEFDEVLTEFSSQKRVYEVVAKPVVEVRKNDPLSPVILYYIYIHVRTIRLTLFHRILVR